MVLQVLPAEEADMYRSAVIEHEAYKPLETNKILFPGPFPPDVLEHRADELKAQSKEHNTFCFKVIDTELEGEQMISFAKWVVYDGTNPPKPRPQRQWPPGINGEACELLFGGLTELKKRVMGDRKHLYLHLLHTDPMHQGRGAGAMLTSRGVEEAARRGLPAYLESSEAAHQLYLSNGFQDLEELATDFSKWGLETPHKAWAMIHD
ncbi:hypothetical protein N8I77_012608 [Diaporthe amygdali]|uniref:N-acetyltransferase domain-containing protein n=1 Tax=Phomopsis amygdali TaxID=1214568 RepID=A0AAD9S4G3_PHOAM|nr:hypothetical protein N8I77_012608 [Diaporthe amygdali]